MVEFFLHVGLHKTGSTVLQNRVFPRIQGIDYLGRPFGTKHFLHRLARSQGDKVLLSSEGMAGMLTEAYAGSPDDPTTWTPSAPDSNESAASYPRRRSFLACAPTATGSIPSTSTI